MQKHWHLIFVLLSISLVSALFGIWRPKKTTTLKAIIAHGYPAEYHRIRTEDGNKVLAIRIPYSPKLNNQAAKRPIVVLQHGLLSCSDIWVASGPNNALAYLLVDAGFDVWLGNSRGNVFSRKVKIPSWDFSWHEIGYYDMAAIIDYALRVNGQGQTSLHYVGHSQGSTVFFVLMSLRPEYNRKIKTAHMLAPVAIMKGLRSECIKCMAEICRPKSLTNWLMGDAATISWVLDKMRTFFNTFGCPILDALHHGGNLNMTAERFASRYFPAGGSNNQILHYCFNILSGEFRHYDYGPRRNRRIYQSVKPPLYPLEKISCEVHLWYSEGDVLTPIPGVQSLAQQLPKMVLHRMPDPKWSHEAFITHKEVFKYINQPVLQIMKRNEMMKSATHYIKSEI